MSWKNKKLKLVGKNFLYKLLMLKIFRIFQQHSLTVSTKFIWDLTSWSWYESFCFSWNWEISKNFMKFNINGIRHTLINFDIDCFKFEIWYEKFFRNTIFILIFLHEKFRAKNLIIHSGIKTMNLVEKFKRIFN